MTQEKTLQNLQVIKDVQTNAKNVLGEKYEEVVKPFYDIINMVMRSSDINEFDAMDKIKELPLYNTKDGRVLFAAALMEIVEEKNFEGFKN